MIKFFKINSFPNIFFPFFASLFIFSFPYFMTMKTIRFFNPSDASPHMGSRTGWRRAWGGASLLIAFIAFAGCTEAPVMTMTGAKRGEASIFLAGSGTAAIDWGDGSAPQAITLSAYNERTGFISSHSFKHDYATATGRTVTAGNVTHLHRTYNGLTALDVSKNTALIYLVCDGNGLTTLDVSNNTALTYLSCNGNSLTAIDVSKNTALTELYCGFNDITALDVSKNAALMHLRCGDNGLTALDVSRNTALTRLYCQRNRLDAAGLDALFGTLHGNPGVKTVYIKGNPGAGTCTQSIATAKGWTVDTATD
jgi:hypothetical protein